MRATPGDLAGRLDGVRRTLKDHADRGPTKCAPHRRRSLMRAVQRLRHVFEDAWPCAEPATRVLGHHGRALHGDDERLTGRTVFAFCSASHNGPISRRNVRARRCRRPRVSHTPDRLGSTYGPPSAGPAPGRRSDGMRRPTNLASRPAPAPRDASRSDLRENLDGRRPQLAASARFADRSGWSDSARREVHPPSGGSSATETSPPAGAQPREDRRNRSPRGVFNTTSRFPASSKRARRVDGLVCPSRGQSHFAPTRSQSRARRPRVPLHGEPAAPPAARGSPPTRSSAPIRPGSNSPAGGERAEDRALRRARPPAPGHEQLGGQCL